MVKRYLIVLSFLGIGNSYAMEPPVPGPQQQGVPQRPHLEGLRQLLNPIDVSNVDLGEDFAEFEGTVLEPLARRLAALFHLFDNLMPFDGEQVPALEGQAPDESQDYLEGMLDSAQKYAYVPIATLKLWAIEKLRAALQDPDAYLNSITELVDLTAEIARQAFSGERSPNQALYGLYTIWKPEVQSVVISKAAGYKAKGHELLADLIENKEDYPALVSKWLGLVEGFVLSRPTFPIKGDADLNNKFTEEQFAGACAYGNVPVVQCFLDKAEYNHFLNMPVGQAEKHRPLFWAVLGYIEGDYLTFDPGFVPNPFEVLRRLFLDQRIEKSFLIRHGLGQISFDEWLLQELSYDEAGKQARLETVKNLLRRALDGARQAQLALCKARKDAHKRALAEYRSSQDTKKINLWTFFGGAGVMGAFLYWMNQHSSMEEAKQDS